MEDFILDDSLFEELLKRDSDTVNSKRSSLDISEPGESKHTINKEKDVCIKVDKEDDCSVTKRDSAFSKNPDDVHNNQERKNEIVDGFVKWLIKERFAERVYTKYRSTLWDMDKEIENKLERSIILEDDIKEIGAFQEIFVKTENKNLIASVIKYFKQYKMSLNEKPLSVPIVEKKQVSEKKERKQVVLKTEILPEFRKWLIEDGFFESVAWEYANILNGYNKSVSLSSGITLLEINDYKKIMAIADMLNKSKRLTNKERIAFKCYISYLKQLK